MEGKARTMSVAFLNQLEDFVQTAYDRLQLLKDKYEQYSFIPEWGDLDNTEIFYQAYRENVVLHQSVMKELVNLNQIVLFMKRNRVDDLEDVSGYSIAAIKKIKKDIQNIQDIIEQIREQLNLMKDDLGQRLKFFSNAQYMLSSPYTKSY